MSDQTRPMTRRKFNQLVADADNELGALFYIMFLGVIYSAVVYYAGVAGYAKAAFLLGVVGILILLVLWLLEKRDQLLR